MSLQIRPAFFFLRECFFGSFFFQNHTWKLGVRLIKFTLLSLCHIALVPEPTPSHSNSALCTKKETEGLILAAQEQALRRNSIKHSVDKTSETPLCSLCGESTETVWHIFSGCEKLAQNEYWKRQDMFAPRVNWEMCTKYGIEYTDKWYDLHPLTIVEIEKWRFA